MQIAGADFSCSIILMHHAGFIHWSLLGFFREHTRIFYEENISMALGALISQKKRNGKTRRTDCEGCCVTSRSVCRFCSGVDGVSSSSCRVSINQPSMFQTIDGVLAVFGVFLRSLCVASAVWKCLRFLEIVCCACSSGGFVEALWHYLLLFWWLSCIFLLHFRLLVFSL